tara:strand:- start:378 stop:656 length:279 start_codon:yes stop_codon:yes gene_type:complete
MFKHSKVNKTALQKLMDKEWKQNEFTKTKMRKESYKNQIENYKQQKSFDISLMLQKTSPTAKPYSHSFQRLDEEKDTFWKELDLLIEELERD